MEHVAQLLRYRNREIGEEDLSFLRAESSRASTRSELLRSVCEAWHWRQHDGKPSIVACRDLLLRLEQRGLLQLPASRRTGCGRRELPLLPADHIALCWTQVEGRLSDHDPLTVRPIASEERAGWRLFMDRYHYLGDKPIVGEHLLYAAFLGSELVALLGWAGAALHVPLRDQFIGWDEMQKRRGLHLVANNVRFLVPPWVRVEHLASKVLALNLRRLSADWQARWNHPLWMAETFVDLARFRGTCYRAANWTLLGQTAGRSRRGNTYLHTGKPKGVFVYELHRNARRLLLEGASTRSSRPWPSEAVRENPGIQPWRRPPPPDLSQGPPGPAG
jgi:hypothetical protein